MNKTLIKGPRGGTYWIDDNGKKHYVKDKKVVTSTKKSTKKEQVSKYYCYYNQYNENGELVDDFKEWCSATSLNEARTEFKNRYWNEISKGSIEIAQIIEHA